ncbi:MAG: hypothetical protein AAFP69_01875, partial [Planctomycetota bacterium]
MATKPRGDRHESGIQPGSRQTHVAPPRRVPATLPYTLSDNVAGDTLTDNGTLTITITNVAPDATDDTNLTDIGTPASGNVLSNDTDPDPNDDLTVT